MKVVLDTNVLISALAFPGTKPDQILSRIRRREIDLFISPFILSEIDRVLQQKFNLSKRDADSRVKAICNIASLVQPKEQITVITAKDDDNRILECAIEAQAEFLVTGDKEHLLPIRSYRGIKIASPAQFLDLLELKVELKGRTKGDGSL